jgi:hypothetical protein
MNKLERSGSFEPDLFFNLERIIDQSNETGIISLKTGSG